MKITLITVSFNSEETICNTLSSVANQSYPELEYIVVDGGSNDKTMEIVQEYSDLVSECISEPDEGIYDAMNKGLQLATGDIIGVLNSDDFYLNNSVLKEVSDLFCAHPNIDVLLGGIDFVNNDNLNKPVRTYRAGNFKPWMFRVGLMPPHPAAFVRKSAYDRVGIYKLGYKIAADFDFLTRLLLIDGANYKVVEKIWVRMRTGGASTNGLKSNLLSTKEMKRSLEENGELGSYFMIFLRLPFKFLTQVFRK